MTVESVAQEPVDLVLRMTATTDLLPMAEVKQGRAGSPRHAEAVESGLRWADGDVELTGDPAPEVDAPAGRLTWRLHLARGERRTITFRARATAATQFASRATGPLVGVGRGRRRPGPAYRRAEPGRSRRACCWPTATTASSRPEARGS